MSSVFAPARLYIAAVLGTITMTTFGLDRAVAVWRFADVWLYAERHGWTDITGGGTKSLAFMTGAFGGLCFAAIVIGAASWVHVWAGAVAFVEVARVRHVVGSPRFGAVVAKWLSAGVTAALAGVVLGQVVGVVFGPFGFEFVSVSLAAGAAWFVVAYFLVSSVRVSYITAVGSAAGVIK